MARASQLVVAESRWRPGLSETLPCALPTALQRASEYVRHGKSAFLPFPSLHPFDQQIIISQLL